MPGLTCINQINNCCFLIYIEKDVCKIRCTTGTHRDSQYLLINFVFKFYIAVVYQKTYSVYKGFCTETYICYCVRKVSSYICYCVRKVSSYICYCVRKVSSYICYCVRKVSSYICYCVRKVSSYICYCVRKVSSYICYCVRKVSSFIFDINKQLTRCIETSLTNSLILALSFPCGIDV